MKKNLLYFFLIINSGFIYSQPSIQWQVSLGGTQNEMPWSIKETPDGGYIVCGSTASHDSDVTVNNGATDMWVVKLNSTGVIEWEKSIGNIHGDEARDVALTSDSGYIIAGTTWTQLGPMDIYIVKLDHNGSIQWDHSYGGTDDDEGRSIQQTLDGGFILLGETWSTDGDVTSFYGESDYWVLKLDSAGNIEWQKNYGGHSAESPYGIIQLADSTYIVAGHSVSYDGDVTFHYGMNVNPDLWIVKLNTVGQIIWQRTIGGTLWDVVWNNEIELTNDGGFVFGAWSSSSNYDVSSNHGSEDFWVLKLDSNGYIVWEKSYGGSDGDYAYSIKQTQDGGYIVAGRTASNDGDITFHYPGPDHMGDCWVIKLDSLGTLEWQKSLGGTDMDNVTCILQASDGGYVFAAGTKSTDEDVTNVYHGGSVDYWIVKLSVSVGVNEIWENSNQIQLMPNPFSEKVKIVFELAKPSRTTIQIHSVDGKLVKSIELEKPLSGRNELYWDGTSNESAKVDDGIYYVTVSSGDNRVTKLIQMLRD